MTAKQRVTVDVDDLRMICSHFFPTPFDTGLTMAIEHLRAAIPEPPKPWFEQWWDRQPMMESPSTSYVICQRLVHDMLTDKSVHEAVVRRNGNVYDLSRIQTILGSLLTVVLGDK